MVWAHSSNESGRRHELVAHLRAVSKMAAKFAESTGMSDLAGYLGLWHDLGKFNPAFQAYLLDSERNPARRRSGPDHKAAGVKLALDQRLQVAALIIQGHHGGLRSPADFKSWFREKSADPGGFEAALDRAHAAIPDLWPPAPISLPGLDEHSSELLVRVLFSALVDADYLDTEAHFAGATAEVRRSERSMLELAERLEADQRSLQSDATAVSRSREEIYEDCLRAAKCRPGIFRLTAPTGAGKTRSAMAFALNHARSHGQERVIVAVPFVSITEQTAAVYRSIFQGDDEDGKDVPVILEHHSNVGEAGRGDELGFRAQWERLAAENWDAPIIVTTTVQLFESLFSNSTSSSRKVHRLSNSVVILDEAQALPEHLLTPILDVLSGLAPRYNTTVVLATATQPAFDEIPAFANVEAQEIVGDVARHFEVLRRVRYEWRSQEPVSWGEVAAEIRGEEQVLVVVNTKRDAFALLEALGDPEALHLSTQLCGAHRRDVIDEVSRRLAAGEPCSLVATQVVEAGVDIDFPVVWRAVGPLDSIIQSAGRCNREGRLDEGHVVVFRPWEGGLPSGVYRAATGITEALLAAGSIDAVSSDSAREYFKRLFATWELDRERIQDLRRSFDFPEVARRFRMIEDATESVVVAYGSPSEQENVRSAIDSLRSARGNPRLLLRRIRPYAITVRSRLAQTYRRDGLITDVFPGVWEWFGDYDSVTGLRVKSFDPDDFVV